MNGPALSGTCKVYIIASYFTNHLQEVVYSFHSSVVSYCSLLSYGVHCSMELVIFIF